MRVWTRSKSITEAIKWVLWRMPPKDREVVERFVFRVTAARAWTPVGTGVDPTSAMLAPLWKVTGVGAKYDRQARVHFVASGLAPGMTRRCASTCPSCACSATRR